jgi:hypothetical protein
MSSRGRSGGALIRPQHRNLISNKDHNCNARPCGGFDQDEAVEVLDDLGSGIKLFCPPKATNNLDRARVIAAYIEARPERMKDGFGLMANEAMAKAWPCK